MAIIRRLNTTNKIHKGDKVDYSWKSGKTEKKGKWQLRVAYKVTSDNIVFDPYLVVSGDGFKESKKCTLKYSYKKLVTSSKTYNWNNKWKEVTKTVSINVKSDKTYFFFDHEKSLNTYKIIITANIGSNKSETSVFGTAKPPRPKIPSGIVGLEHDVDRSNIWKIHFAYEPKGGSNDYAAPVNKWHIARMSTNSQNNWTEIHSQNTNHDANGFRDVYTDDSPSTGDRYKWKVWFTNSNGSGPARTYPTNTANGTIKVGGLKTKSQEDKFKEWAYMPPSKIDSFSEVHRNDTNVRFSWTRDTKAVSRGIYRGYFIQYRANEDVDKAESNKATWSQAKIGRKLSNSSKWNRYILENFNDANDYEETISCYTTCSTNKRYQFRLVPFNFDKGVKPSSILYSGTHVQKATPSSVYETIYYKPAAPNSVKAVPSVDNENNPCFKVTVDISRAYKGPVNSIIITRRYQYEDGTNSDWIKCIDNDTGQEIEDKGLKVDRNKKAYTYLDKQSLPDYHGTESKRVINVQYSAKLGAVSDNEDGGSGVFPTLSKAFSEITAMTNWVSAFKKPKVPTLISPELNRAFAINEELVRLSWVHNPNDGTDQSSAKLDIFVFSESAIAAAGGTIPTDFFTNYNIDTVHSEAKNEVTIDGNTSYYDLSISKIADGELVPSSEPNYLYRITGIDTSTKRITEVSQSTFSANDVVLWRVKTAGGDKTNYSDFTDEYRIFNIYGVPSITLSVSNIHPDTSVLSTLPTTVTWNYTDQSGEMESLNLYLMQNGQVLETYEVNIEDDQEFTFSYIFDDGMSYTLTAEATSSTTLSAYHEISFTVQYATVIFKKHLTVNAEFKELTGFAEITLSEELDEGSEDESVDISVPDGSDVTRYNGSGFKIYLEREYNEETGHLILKALLDNAVSDILMASASESLSNANFYPSNDRFPGDDVYPNSAVLTNDTDLTYVLFDEYLTRPSVDSNIYVYFSIPSRRGTFYEIIDSETGEKSALGSTITGYMNYLDGSSNISLPVLGVLIDELDLIATPDDVIRIDKPVSEAYLYRVYRGVKTYIGGFTPNFSDVTAEIDPETGEEIPIDPISMPTSTTTIIDRFCPINRIFTYQLVQLTADGEVSFSEVEFEFNTLYWYCYWGPTYSNIVKARWNPTGSSTYSRPERQSVRYSGRTYPVIYDSDAMDETYNFTTELFDDDYMIDYLGDDETALETIELYRQLMVDGGVGFWKSFDGNVYFASFDFNYSIDYTDNVAKYPCSLSVTRIEGDEIFSRIEKGEEVFY